MVAKLVEPTKLEVVVVVMMVVSVRSRALEMMERRRYSATVVMAAIPMVMLATMDCSG